MTPEARRSQGQIKIVVFSLHSCSVLRLPFRPTSLEVFYNTFAKSQLFCIFLKKIVLSSLFQNTLITSIPFSRSSFPVMPLASQEGDHLASTEVIKLALRRNSKSRLVLTEPEPPSLKMGNRPTKRAIRMANALVLEQKLHAGEFRSLTDVCDTFGITRMVLSKTLDMLDHTPEEISSFLRETY